MIRRFTIVRFWNRRITRSLSEDPAVAVIHGFLEGLILVWYSKCLRALLLGIAIVVPAAAATPEAETRDPFDTGRYVPSSPGVRWQSPFELPRVPDAPGAPSPSTDRPLSLPELTEFALQNNPRTRQAWYATRAAAAAIGIERSDDFPQITASLSVQRSESGSQTGNQNPWLTRYGPAVTLSYLLFDFGAGDSRVQAVEYQALAAALTQNRVLQDVVFQVEQAYFRMLGTERLVQANELFLKSVSTSLDATQRRLEGGLATVADVYRAETQVAQGQLNLTRSRGELEKARGALASAVGLPVNATLSVQTFQGAPRVQEITESLNEILKRAKLNRPDLVAAEAQTLSARALADAAAKSTLPSITIDAASGRNFYNGDRPFTDTNSILLNLRIPIFTGFQHTYTVRQSGFGSLLDLITAQVEESNARVQRIQSFLDWFTAVARLNFAIGASDKTSYPVQIR